ncbi:MAG: hypothetical protein HKN93_06160 [Acidimicrobiia bacterium]|nr:hypothetical protein [Acidimicrobiia bacterium]
MISPEDRHLFRHTTSIDDAIAEIRTFYGNYHSQRFVNGKLVLRVKNEPDDALIEDLNEEFADILVDGRIEKSGPTKREIDDDDEVDLPRVTLHFNRKHLGRLRLLLDRLNQAALSADSTN